MSDFVTLTCPSCGGKLQITNNVERFACSNCGNEHIVRRSGGIVSLDRVMEGLGKVQTGIDKTASELAIRRLREEIPILEIKKRNSNNQFHTIVDGLEDNYTDLERQIKIVEGQIFDNLAGLIVSLIIILGLILLCSNAAAAKYISVILSFITLPSIYFLWKCWTLSQSLNKKNALIERLSRVEKKISATIKSLSQELQAETTDLDQELIHKRDELRRHEQIVSSR